LSWPPLCELECSLSEPDPDVELRPLRPWLDPEVAPDVLLRVVVLSLVPCREPLLWCVSAGSALCSPVSASPEAFRPDFLPAFGSDSVSEDRCLPQSLRAAAERSAGGTDET
jgi:hypothetical protein